VALCYKPEVCWFDTLWCIGIFHRHNPSGLIMALGLTQPLTEISTRNFSWGVKAVGAYGWQPYHLHVPTVLRSGSLNPMEPSESVQACTGMALLLLLNFWSCFGALNDFRIYHYTYSLSKKSRQKYVVCVTVVTYEFSSNPL
jgi:hypothetical protein